MKNIRYSTQKYYSLQMQLLASSDIAHITIEPDMCIAQRESTQHTRVFLLAYMRAVMNVKITAFERSKRYRQTNKERWQKERTWYTHNSNNNDNKNSNKKKKYRAHEPHNAPPRRACKRKCTYDRIEEKENLAWYFDCIRFSTM